MIKLTIFAAGVSLAALTMPTAHAQTNEQPAAQPEPAEAAQTEGNDIIVTARRREERLQDVPIAIVALSGTELTERNVTRIEDLQRVAPGFVIQPSPFGTAALTVTLRSQRQALPNPTYDPSVAIYFAEVIQGRSQGLNGAIYDLGSVQVLKGPQGTLFGRNTTGGAVLLTPQAPTRDFEGYGTIGFGDYDRFQMEGALNLPLGDVAQLRISGRHSEHGGYNRVLGTDRHVDTENVDAVRLSLRLAPSANFTNSLVVDYVNDTSSGTGYKLKTVSPTGAVATGYQVNIELAALQAQPFHTVASNTADDGTRIKGLTVSNITTLDLGDVTLKNVLGYRYLNARLAFDLDGSSKDPLTSSEHVRLDQYSAEPQILGQAFGGALDYIVGGYLFQETGNDRQLTPTLGTLSDVDIDVDNRSYAVFAQGTWRLPFAEGVSLTAGARQTWDKRELTTRNRRGGVCRLRVDANGNLSDTATTPLNPCTYTVNTSFDALTYNLTADWQIDRRVTVYLAHRRGYRSGGFVSGVTKPAELKPYAPEFISDFELGLKSDYGAGDFRGRSNVALYSGNYTDIQRNLTIPTTENGQTFVRSVILNAASARVQGVEIDQMLRLFDTVEFNLSYAYSDAKYKSFITPDGLNYTRSPFGGAPKHTLSGRISVDLPVPESAGEVTAQVSGSYRSKSVFADVTSFNPVTQTVFPNDVVPGYATFDARLDWKNIAGSRISADVFVRNLTDKEYFVAGQDFASLGFSSVILGAPRTFGADLRFEF